MSWSLKAVMDAVVALERTVHPDLTVYRWRPRSYPEVPATYNLLGPVPREHRDLAHFDETIRLRAFVAVGHTDEDEQMAQVETYADAFRNVMDPAIHRNQPLGDTVLKASRLEMRTVFDEFAGAVCFTVEFPLDLVVSTLHPPN